MATIYENDGMQLVHEPARDVKVRRESQPGLEYYGPVPVVQEEKHFANSAYQSVGQIQPNGHYHSSGQIQQEYELKHNEKLGRTYCGMSKLVFVIICAVVGIVVVGAAVGGGVGAAMNNKKSATLPNVSSTATTAGAERATSTISSASSTSTLTSTSTSQTSSSASATSTASQNTSPSPFPSSGMLDLDCPNIDQTVHISNSINFQVQCHTNYIDTVPSIAGYNITTLNACMDKCVSYNGIATSTKCVAVVFQSNLTEAEKPEQHANCWFAGSTSGKNSNSPGTIASAVITS